MRSKKKKNSIYYRFISLLLIVVSVLFIGIINYIDLLPNKYFKRLLIIVLVFDLFNILFINLKRLKKKPKKFFTSCSLVGILIMTFISFYAYKTVNVLNSNSDTKYKLGNYSVIVLKTSKYDSIGDIKNENIGYFENSIGFTQAKNELEKEVKIDFKSYSSSDKLIKDLLDSKVKVILLEDSIKSVIDEEFEDFSSSVKTIYSFTIKDEVKTIVKEVEVTEEPFAIYISGIDTYGQISSVSRSDVNIVMIVNPNTNQVLLISIPRDYYVQLHDTKGAKDKLTHAGIYGIDMSINTIEDLLDVDINYYIKVNFTSVIDIVDALGGLDVYSEYSFTSFSNFDFKKGMNYVNGEQALDFVRTRKAFSNGDRQRGKNQQALIEALIRKMTNKSTIMKYNSLLNAINGKYQTNMGMKKITSLIKKQLDSMPSWNITSYSLSGTDSKNYTYTCNQLLYVMEPDQKSVNEAKDLIKKVLNDETLDSSYKNTDGESNKVTKSQEATSVKEETKIEKSENKDEENIDTKDSEKSVEEPTQNEESNTQISESKPEEIDEKLGDEDIMGEINSEQINSDN